MRYLTSEDILNIHSVIVDETGGVHGVRDRHALAALEGLPQQKVFGRELYSNQYIKTAVYTRNIIFGHPFVDGNKRTAVACASIFLQLNGFVFNAMPGEIESYAVSIVTKRRALEDIARWLKAHSKRIYVDSNEV